MHKIPQEVCQAKKSLMIFSCLILVEVLGTRKDCFVGLNDGPFQTRKTCWLLFGLGK